MARINIIENPEGKAKELLDGIQAKFGMTPNFFKTLAHSPVALEAYLMFMDKLAEGLLDDKLARKIALSSAGTNKSKYCASIHTLMGKGMGIEESELKENLSSKSTDQKTQAALNFVSAIISTQGNVSDSDLEAVRNAGFSDAEIMEIVTHTCFNMLGNYLNLIAQTELDIPLVKTD